MIHTGLVIYAFLLLILVCIAEDVSKLPVALVAIGSIVFLLGVFFMEVFG